MADCERCGHGFADHTLVATSEDPATGGVDPFGGGIVLCPVPGCLCYATWGVQGAPAKRVPDAAEVEGIRTAIQTPGGGYS